MRSSAPLKAVLAAALAISVAGCSPKPPKGVDEDALRNAIGERIGDLSTCVVLAQTGSGKTLWTYEALHACARVYAACDEPGERSALQLSREAAAGKRLQTGCDSVSWAAGPTPRDGVVYAAVMFGERALPGMEIARRLDQAFAETGF